MTFESPKEKEQWRKWRWLSPLRIRIHFQFRFQFLFLFRSLFRKWLRWSRAWRVERKKDYE